jgi:hypothetical protein
MRGPHLPIIIGNITLLSSVETPNIPISWWFPNI